MSQRKISSKTEHVPGPPILGGLFGGGDYWRTTNSDEGNTVTGCGNTSEKSQKEAAKEWEKQQSRKKVIKA